MEAERGAGNSLSSHFQSYWDAIARVAIVGTQHEKAMVLVQQLPEGLSVGFINLRSITFYMERQGVLMRGPYAHVLQLPGVLLSRERWKQLKTNALTSCVILSLIQSA